MWLEPSACFNYTKRPLSSSNVVVWFLFQVSFESFPQQLFEGEICRHGMTLINVGNKSLGHLRFICSWPSFFVLDPTLTGQSKSSDVLHRRSSNLFIKALPALTSDQLLPTQTFHQSFWIRAPQGYSSASQSSIVKQGPSVSLDQSQHPLPSMRNLAHTSTQSVHFVFGYAATEPTPNVLR